MTTQGRLNPTELGPRARELVTTARELLEADGPDGLSMRRLGQRLGISAPALYRYFPDKRSLENAIIYEALMETGDRLIAALDAAGDTLTAVCRAYRAWALEHPHLYQLIYARPLDRDRLDPAAEAHAAEALRRVLGADSRKARAVWVFAHGMTLLEIDGGFPPETDLDDLWAYGTAALSSPA